MEHLVIKNSWFYGKTTDQKNPYFPYDFYESFDLETMNEDECIAEFRMRKQDIPIVVDALQLPATIQCSQRTICDADEALCMLLRRFCYPCRYSDLIGRFDLTHQKQKSKTSKNIIIPKDFFLANLMSTFDTTQTE
ncbi:predicted protein [Nematostella vectensis]|uniref:Uncharacterized protein n=1 Tax=Nematostella vectensis TaxID=45351 RepID=A7SK60_NEMVE|nr:predicted protein [Nematostella vectensis]|eukprot:XP_001627947.1 predicted protein [Nematostella vectensis]